MNKEGLVGVGEVEWGEFETVAIGFGATTSELLGILIRSVNRHPDIIYDIMRESMRLALTGKQR